MSTAGSREINVTPLIDVLLVLLIIFLVMMPIMLRFEPLQIPPKSTEVSGETGVAVKLQADLSFSIDDGPMFPHSELAKQLRSKVANAHVVFVDFVDGVPWQGVMATVDIARGVASDVTHSDIPVALRLRGEQP